MKKKQLILLAGICLFSQFSIAQNTKYGNGAGPSVTGNYNTLVGENSGFNLTTGTTNSLFGHTAGYSLTTGGLNTMIGFAAGRDGNTTAAGNSFFGYSAGMNNTGDNNSYFGLNAGRGLLNSFYTLCLGRDAGYTGNNPSSGTVLTNVILIGAKTSAFGNLTNATAIGYQAAVSSNNALVLGAINGTNGATASTNVGIGLTAPTAPLEIKASAANTSGLKFTQLTSASTAAAANGKALSVDASGNVVLVTASTSSNYFATAVGVGVQPNASYMLSVCGAIRAKDVSVETGWCDFVFDKNYKLRSLPNLKQYIADNHHLPEIPSAKEVEENGVQLASMTSKLLLKVEELTLYVIKQNEKIEKLEKELKARTKK